MPGVSGVQSNPAGAVPAAATRKPPIKAKTTGVPQYEPETQKTAGDGGTAAGQKVDIRV